jgi:hypothetical protein
MTHETTDIPRTVIVFPSARWRRKVFVWGVAFWATLLGGKLEVGE